MILVYQRVQLSVFQQKVQRAGHRSQNIRYSLDHHIPALDGFLHHNSFSSIPQRHNTFTYSKTCSMQSRITPLLKTANNVKHHFMIILGDVHSQHILNAPQFSCPPACIPRHHHQPNSVCRTPANFEVARSRHQLFSPSIFHEHQHL